MKYVVLVMKGRGVFPCIIHPSLYLYLNFFFAPQAPTKPNQTKTVDEQDGERSWAAAGCEERLLYGEEGVLCLHGVR